MGAHGQRQHDSDIDVRVRKSTAAAFTGDCTTAAAELSRACAAAIAAVRGDSDISDISDIAKSATSATLCIVLDGQQQHDSDIDVRVRKSTTAAFTGDFTTAAAELSRACAVAPAAYASATTCTATASAAAFLLAASATMLGVCSNRSSSFISRASA
jgi:predicted nucleotidyltransferase